MKQATPVRIRTALKDDVSACAALFAAGQQEIEPRAPPWRASEFLEQVASEELLVAGAGAQVAGFLSFWRRDAFVHFLHVAKAWRGRGVGCALLEAARNEVSRPLELKCLATNTAALAFYSRLGWQITDRCHHPPAPYVRLRQRE
jgi:ribosomal protein S18 acetylase RimI-like enzyme